MNSVKTLLEAIRKRPAMYLGSCYISCLKSYLDGWSARDFDSISDAQLMSDFQDWIVGKFKVKTSHSWNSIILFYSQDESAALNDFFDLFDEFLSERDRF